MAQGQYKRRVKAEANAPQALSGAGTISLDTEVTFFTSTGGSEALTLLDGKYKGQIKKINHVVDGGSGVITAGSTIHLANSMATITFTNANDSCELCWNGSAWEIVNINGATASA